MQDFVRERIKGLLQEKGMNVTTLGKKINMPQNTLTRQINGGVTISLDVIMSILKLYPDVSPEWLLMGKGEMLKEPLGPSNSNKTVNFNDHRAGESIQNKPVSREEYEELRSKYLNSLEENIRLRDKLDEIASDKRMSGA